MYQCVRSVPIFIVFGHLSSSQPKKQNQPEQCTTVNCFTDSTFVFFLRATQMSKCSKIWSAPPAQNYLPCTKNLDFYFIFLWIISWPGADEPGLRIGYSIRLRRWVKVLYRYSSNNILVSRPFVTSHIRISTAIIRLKLQSRSIRYTIY